jgi:hypothetical protein
VNTEMTDIKNENGCVCFDAECSLWANLARRVGPFLHRDRLGSERVQAEWVKDRLAKSDEELLPEMRLLTGEGRIYGGANALSAIAHHVWWSKPVAAFVPLLLALALGRTLTGWIWTWMTAFALFIGAKWVTVFHYLRPERRAYALLWPGMDVRAFCGDKLVPPPPLREWALAAAKTLFGAAVIFVAVPSTGAEHPLISGWIGMVGMVLLLHFGLFHLLSLLWRALGINARPLMQSPGAATSLGRFWGGSWNTAFTDLMHETLFKPLNRHVGPQAALLLVFIISGVLHEMVLSLPAHGGYGLPMAYFLLQGFALLFERSTIGRKLGLGSGLRGWCFLALVTGVPAFWLFNPVFIHNVILPMLNAIGAT